MEEDPALENSGNPSMRVNDTSGITGVSFDRRSGQNQTYHTTLECVVGI